MRDQNFFVSKFPTSIFEKYFLENIFSKIEKSKNRKLWKNRNSMVHLKKFDFSFFHDFRFFDFSIFEKIFSTKIFSENRPTKNMDKKVFISHFFREKIFSWIQKQKLRPALYFPKHPKTLPTDQNSQNGSQKTGGGSFNYRTQFIS